MLLAPLIALGVCLPADAARADEIAPAGIDRQAFDAYLRQTDLSADEIKELIEIAESIKARTKERLTVSQRLERALLDPWVIFGFMAQAVFGFRFVYQLIVSERLKRSHVPVGFWYLSLVGGLMLFAYALLYRRDPVFTAGQGLGVFIYLRNLILIHRRRDRSQELLQERQQRNANRLAAGPADTPSEG
jgi:lipid-A-disaccharide synthase-like uncharacterized protein